MKIQKKNMRKPDETRKFKKGSLKIVSIGKASFGLYTFHPGWKWSTCVKPLVGTQSCQSTHTEYHISGTLRVKMDSGEQYDLKAGDVAIIPPGHDAWVVGKETVMALDLTGMVGYAKKK